jgi:hypothetical protein
MLKSMTNSVQQHLKNLIAIRTSLRFVRISFTDDNCFVICAISPSDSVNDINNCSRSGLR